MSIYKQPIVSESPLRPVGQHNAYGLRTVPLSVVHVGFIGLGERGCQAVMRWCHIPHTEIVAICDISTERIHSAKSIMADNGVNTCFATNNAEILCQREDVDLVYICTDWESHADLVCCALANGKHVAVEVPAAVFLRPVAFRAND